MAMPAPKKFSTAPFLVYALSFLAGQYLAPSLFHRGILTRQGQDLQVLYVVVAHPLMTMGLHHMFSVSYVKARKNKWATGAEALKLMFSLTLIT